MATLNVPLVQAGSILGAAFPVYVPDTLRIEDQPSNPYEHVFHVLTKEDGDKRVIWDSRDLAQIRDAKKMFLNLIKQGQVPYKIGVDGNASSEQMAEFDPNAEEVIFLPIKAVKGG
jgi:hypothetical protein